MLLKCGDTGAPMHYKTVCKLEMPFSKAIWQYLIDARISLLDISSREIVLQNYKGPCIRILYSDSVVMDGVWTI